MALIQDPLATTEFPPSYLMWAGDNEKYAYFGSMVAGVDTPNGYQLGRVALSVAGDAWSITGDTDGVAIDSEGMITIADNTQLSAGGKLLTVTRVNGSTTDTVTVPYSVYDDSSSVAFFAPDGDDSNDGLQPHKPRQTLADSIDFNRRKDKMLFLRGAEFDGCLPIRGDRIYASFGDPLNQSPKINYSTLTSDTLSQTYDSCIHTQRTNDDSKAQGISNVTVQDFICDGNGIAQVLFEGSNSDNYRYKRIHLRNNIEHANSSGLRVQECDDGGVIRHITTESLSVFGDGIYGVELKSQSNIYEFGYCKLGAPLGIGGDCLQITDDGDPAGQTCYNVWVHDIHANQNLDSNSTKGAMVVQGTRHALIEDCTLVGKYFGIGYGITHGTIRRCVIDTGGLPQSNGNWQDTWGIGCGGDRAFHSVSVYDCIIDGGSTKNDTYAYSGLLLSGFNLNGLDRERYDIEYIFNKVSNCGRFGRASGAASWSGIIANNLAQNNVLADGTPADTFEDAGQPVATQGTYQAQILEQPHVGIFKSQSDIGLYGSTLPNQDISAATLIAAGESIVGYQWRINGVSINGVTSKSYTIQNADEGLTLRAPQLNDMNKNIVSCVVTVEDESGNRDFLISEYYTVGVASTDLPITESEVGFADTTAPVITLTPNQTAYTLTVGQPIPNINAVSDDDSAVTFNDVVVGNVTTRTYSATDASGNTRTIDVVFTFEEVPNTAPVIESISNQSVGAGEPVTITATANDAENDNLTYTFRQISGTSVALNQSGNTVTFTAPSLLTESSIQIGVIVSDGIDTSAEEMVTILITAETPSLNETMLLSEFGSDALYLGIDNVFSLGLVDNLGDVLRSDDVQNIEYFIGDKRGNVKFLLTLNNGILIEDGKAIVCIHKSALTFIGEYTHQLVVTNVLNQRLPPMLNNSVVINPAFQ